MYKVNYHIHTNFSDGKAELEKYVLESLKKEFNEIGFSDHLIILGDGKVGSNSMKIEKIKEYVKRINLLKEKFKNKIKIKLGIEVDYFPFRERLIAKIINQFDFDYILGSVHRIDDFRIDAKSNLRIWNEMSEREIYNTYKKYFSLVQKTVSSKLFDIIAHPDFVKVFNFKPKRNIKQLYLKTIKKISKNNICIEVNSAGLREAVNEIYPNKVFLSLCYKNNIPVTMGNDAHSPELIESDLNQLINYIKNIGYNKVVTFNKRKRKLVKILK